MQTDHFLRLSIAQITGFNRFWFEYDDISFPTRERRGGVMNTTYICPAIAFKNEDGFNIYCDVQTITMFNCACKLYVYKVVLKGHIYSVQKDLCLNDTCVARIVFALDGVGVNTLYIGKHYNYNLNFYKAFCWFLNCFNLSDFEDAIKAFMHNLNGCDILNCYKLRRWTSACDVESFEFGNYKCLM